MKTFLLISSLLFALPLASYDAFGKTESIKNKSEVITKSENSFIETYSKLKSAIEAKAPLTIIAELDHAKNAEKNAAMKLRPTRVIMFGNPKLGTPLMQENQQIGLHLPQKMLVYEDKDGSVFISYLNPKAIAASYGITDQDEILTKISKALSGLAQQAAR